MKTIKKITSLVIMLTVFAVAAGQSFAAFEAINDTTGAGSINNVSATETNDFVGKSTSDALVNNFGIGVGNTGGETTNCNTGIGATDTGDVVVTGGFTNGVGVSTTNYYDDWDGDFTAENNTTGANSVNIANAWLDNDIKVKNKSIADVKNFAFALGNSGFNSASCNTCSGQVETGEVSVGASETNMVNLNYTGITLEMDGIEVDATNQDTGCNSYNKAIAGVKNEVEVKNINDAYVENWAFAVANTGFNSANGNSGSGTVITGEALAEVGIINGVNYNETDVIINMADADLNASNNTTGCHSKNYTTVVVDNDVDVVNRNYAEVDNLGIAVANTGINSADCNTGIGTVTTGEADAETVIDNEININLTDVDIDLGDAEITASNDTTGANSVNRATATVVNDVDVTNRNNADVDNIVVSVSNSGLNSADCNTGGGTVDSGNANATTSVTNDVNINDTAITITGSDLEASNNDTGCGSTNTAIASETNTVNVTNNNTAVVDNTVVTVSNTGGNTADCNTGTGSSTTGDATVSFGATNVVNNNATTVGAGSEH
jgi:hypothetical protein